MKKAYVKPEIFFESFMLSSSIAGDCETETNLQSRGGCGYMTRDGIVFVDMTMNCNVGVPYNDTESDYIYNNSLCYHIPIDTKNLFNS